MVKTANFSIPVYSASKNENLIFGYVTKDSKWKKYKNLLTWNKDGSSNYVFYRKESFVPYEKVKLLKLKENYNDKLIYDYLKIIIQESMIAEGFDFNKKCSMERVLKLLIPIPFDANGEIDKEAQLQVIKKHESIIELKSQISEYKNQIEKLIVVTETSGLFKEFILSDIFDFPSIKGLTASNIQKNKGTIPVYGGRKEELPVGFIKDNLPKVKYFDNCLAWNREGSVGFVFWHKHKFTTNDHHRPLLVKKEYEKVVDLNYMKYTLEKKLLSQGFEWSKTASKEKVEKLTVSIPILSNGNIDLKTQQDIAITYLKVDAIKKGILDELDRISKTEIEFE